jgi:hypothetical protein
LQEEAVALERGNDAARADELSGVRRCGSAALNLIDVERKFSESASQLFVDDEVLRGVGVLTEKSMLLLFESKQPPRLRWAAVVLLRFPVGPAPSKALAVLP